MNNLLFMLFYYDPTKEIIKLERLSFLRKIYGLIELIKSADSFIKLQIISKFLSRKTTFSLNIRFLEKI